MKLTKVLIVAIAASGFAQTHAAGVTRLTGTSSASANWVWGLKSLCEGAGGTFVLYKTSSSLSSLDEQFTVRCSTDFAGTTLNDVRFNVAGGSHTAVAYAAGNPASTTTSFLVGDSSCVSLDAGIQPLNFLAAGQMKNCGTSLDDRGRKSDGGFLDFEGPVFDAIKYDPADFQLAGYSQVFGVAVNRLLYNDLQAYQKTVAGGNIVPASCAAGDPTAACQPSLSRAQIGALMNSDNSSAAKSQGGQYLVPSSTVGKITYCMQFQNAGAQQAAQLYFLGAAANGDLGGAEVIHNVGISPSGKYQAIANLRTDDVRTCLNDGTGYRFGIVSLENDPIGGTDTYRFVRINEVAGAEGQAGANQNRTAINGRYDFVYEMSVYCPRGVCAEIITSLQGRLRPGSQSRGTFRSYFDSPYGRGGNAAAPYVTR